MNIHQSNNKLIINDKEYDIPGNGNNVTIINDIVFVNGYQLKDDKWVRTLRALWYKYF